MTTSSIAVDDLKAAIEGRDAARLISLYADDAVMRIIDATTRRAGRASSRDARRSRLSMTTFAAAP